MENNGAAMNERDVHFQLPSPSHTTTDYNALIDTTTTATTATPPSSPSSPPGTAQDPESSYVSPDQPSTNVNVNSSSAPSVLLVTTKDDANDYDNANLDVRSFASTVLTADGIADPTSFKVNCLIVFLGDMSRGIFFPTMWELVQQLGGDQVMLGYVIASFSFGRMLVLPLFGSWSTKYGYKWTLQISTFILFLGTILFAQVLTVQRAWYLIFANIMLGIGSGTLGVTMAYASEVTPKRQRTGYIAWVTAVQYAGTTATPFIGSLFIVLCAREREDQEYKGFPEINEFTAPALFMSFMSATSLFLITKYFEDRQRGAKESPRKLSARQYANEELANTSTCFGFFTVRTLCLIGCMALNAFTKGPMSCFETLGIEFAESRFDMHRAEAGSIVATMGLLGAMSLMAMGLICQKFDDTQLTSGGVLLFIIGIFINTQLDQDEMNAPWRYSLSMFLCYSIGYPVCHTALVGLFSKIVGRRPQGTLQGWFSASGSVARISFPILAGYIVSDYDIETLFKILAIVLLIASSFLVAFRRVLTTLAS
eukprot:CAMPEP_0203700368 /NCGR_PEP_ID=MMETSP0091-20130426/30917_1 /ASSEMBLY_ACC=CAM_ASM_001089 /TAXON_ID=426623 /ORGANISM="Chaetoceros affinis, Strain CCMP159" /LENGTH=538 /DNA_ID=CAMNT_0050573613 /DNA_START=89 /DNA_END=1705 /DNA_ORIENTATION=-